MKTTIKFLFSLLIVAVCAGFVSAQTPTVKIAVIDSGLFTDEKVGIVKYVNALKVINGETQPKTTELQNMLNRAQTLQRETEQMREAYQKNPNGPIGPAQIQPKIDELEKIKREGTYKQEDLNRYVQSRRQQLLGPIIQDIAKALQEYAKQKAYTVIFDLAKDNTGFLVALGDDKIDVTKDFIAFYNARPTTPASTPRTN